MVVVAQQLARLVLHAGTVDCGSFVVGSAAAAFVVVVVVDEAVPVGEEMLAVSEVLVVVVAEPSFAGPSPAGKTPAGEPVLSVCSALAVAAFPPGFSVTSSAPVGGGAFVLGGAWLSFAPLSASSFSSVPPAASSSSPGTFALVPWPGPPAESSLFLSVVTAAEVVSLVPSVLTTASVPSPSAVFSVLRAVASLFPSVVSVALYEFSSVLPSFEFVAIVEIEDFHRKVEYFVHFGLNASVGTDVETLNIADRKHCLSEMSLCWRQQWLPL